MRLDAVRRTSSKASSSRRSSRRRPTNIGAARSGTPATVPSPTTRHTRSGSAFPFTAAGGSCSNPKTPRTRVAVASPTTTDPLGASDCIRDAVFTTSPATASPTWGPEPNATIASPVFTATRTASSGSTRRRSSIDSRIRSPARTARTGSSSWAMGAPNTPMAASPMNLSRVPPNRSMSAFTRVWKGTRIRRTSSGSARSDRSVKPTRSTNRTETTRRSSVRGASKEVVRATPQVGQKAAPGGVRAPHEGQTATREVYGVLCGDPAPSGLLIFTCLPRWATATISDANGSDGSVATPGARTRTTRR